MHVKVPNVPRWQDACLPRFTCGVCFLLGVPGHSDVVNSFAYGLRDGVSFRVRVSVAMPRSLERDRTISK